MAHGQYIRSCFTPSPLAPVAAVAALPTSESQRAASSVSPTTTPSTPVASSLEMKPSVCVSERYDTNVFFAPPTPGLTPEDFVTNITPKLLINHNGELAAGFLDLAGFGEAFARNPDLNYFGGRSVLSLNLDNSIKRLVPNASLRVTDLFSYTPLAPGFASLAAGTSPSNPANIQNAYAFGVLTQRTNNLNNNGSVLASYATTALTKLEASYSNSILRWGSSPSSVPQATALTLFDSTIQSGTVGGSARLSDLDMVNAKYSYTATKFSDSQQATPSILYDTQTATVGWSRTLTESFAAELGGGGIIVSPGPTTPGLTTWAANAALTMNIPNSRATIAYSRSAFPAIAVEPIVLIGDIVTLSAIQTVDQHWQIAEAGSFARSTGGDGSSKLTFESYTASVDIYYWITHFWSAALSFDYMKFNYESAITRYNFDRQAITLCLRADWS